MFLLDTDIASFIINGRSRAVTAELASIPPDQVGVSAVTRAELTYGLMRLPDAQRLHTTVREFLGIVRVPAWDAAAADEYGRVRHKLTTGGQPIGEMDMMIAAHALALGVILVTNNTRHFRRIGLSLDIVHWDEA